jgi:hypothetical protein
MYALTWSSCMEMGSLNIFVSCALLKMYFFFFRLTSMHQLATTLLHLTWVAWVKAKYGLTVKALAGTGQLTQLLVIAAHAATVVPITRRSVQPTVGTRVRNGMSIILVWPVSTIMAYLYCSHWYSTGIITKKRKTCNLCLVYFFFDLLYLFNRYPHFGASTCCLYCCLHIVISLFIWLVFTGA